MPTISTGWPGSIGHVAYRVPVFALDEDPAAGGINARQGGDGLAEHGFAAGAHGQELRAQARADDEDEERRGHQRGGNDVHQREPEGGVGAVEEHQRAEEERDDAAECEHTMRGRIDIHDEQDHRQADQRQAGDVNRQNGRHVEHEDQRNRAYDARQDRARDCSARR